MSTMASQITGVSILYTQPFIRAQIKENIKAPRHWPSWGEFTGYRHHALLLEERIDAAVHINRPANLYKQLNSGELITVWQKSPPDLLKLVWVGNVIKILIGCVLFHASIADGCTKKLSPTRQSVKKCVDTMVNKVEGLDFLAISLVDNFDCKLTGGISFHV